MTNGATYYFCVAILRCSSYNKYCTPLRPGARRIEQRAAYNKFMKGFMDAVSVTNAGSMVPMHERTDDNGNFLNHEDAANANNNTRANGSARTRPDGTLSDATNRDTRPTVMLLAPPVLENDIENIPPRITRPLWEVREAPGMENGRPRWTAVYR